MRDIIKEEKVIIRKSSHRIKKLRKIRGSSTTDGFYGSLQAINEVLNESYDSLRLSKNILSRIRRRAWLS
jgi:hypothetical protein